MRSPFAIRSACALFAIGSLFIAQPPMAAESGPDFNREIRPIFENHCYKCHGPEKQKGGLRFDTKEGASKNGESGEPPILPKNAANSRLIRLVSSRKEDEWMPPKGERLTPAEIDLLKRWINAGAQWPVAASTVAGNKIVRADATHWSFQPLKTPAAPKVRNAKAAATTIDRFIVSRLEQKSLAMRPQAEPMKLVRRIYFDLIGLPPTPEQVDTFVRAYKQNARSSVSALVDELLANPHYGERWARHWLDVARYADSDGQESDADRLTAYHFRDFVIESFNDDRPFDEFVRFQLAGDEIEPNNPRAVAATGFIVAGTHAMLGPNLLEDERMRERYNDLDDMISTTGVAMMGLTLGCARCHDHKYDPIPRRDYYQIMCAFNGGDRAEAPLVPLEEARRLKAEEDAWKKDFDAAKKRFSEAEKPKKARERELRNERIDALEVSADEKLLLKNKPDDSKAKELARKISSKLKVEDKEIRSRLNEKELAELEVSEKEFKATEARKPKPMPTAYGFADFGPTPRETFLLARGDFHAKSEPVQLGFLTALTRDATPKDYFIHAKLYSARNDSTQQRRAMADWMTDLDHGCGALVARVIVNRVWQHHFGQGLVRTVNDFGARCDPPTHPELLEWLTTEFVKSGWKIKTLHRLIMNSNAYLQDTTHDAVAAKVDPDDRLLWRRRPLRLEAEILRDSMLAVSGTLNNQMFGPAIKAPIVAEAIQARNMTDPYPKDLKDNFAAHRRSIYIFHKRVVQQPLMQAFDGPDAQASCGRRENTTVAPQALELLNDSIIRTTAIAFAERTLKNSNANPEDRIQWAWRVALGREPTSAELQSSVEFIKAQQSKRSSRDNEKQDAEKLALADFCQAIFALNEFIYID